MPRLGVSPIALAQALAKDYEHFAQQDVRPDPVGAAVVDRPYLQVDGLEGPKGALDLRQVLVGAHGLGGIELFGLDVGTHDVEPVELLFVAGGEERLGTLSIYMDTIIPQYINFHNDKCAFSICKSL